MSNKPTDKEIENLRKMARLAPAPDCPWVGCNKEDFVQNERYQNAKMLLDSGKISETPNWRKMVGFPEPISKYGYYSAKAEITTGRSCIYEIPGGEKVKVTYVTGNRDDIKDKYAWDDTVYVGPVKKFISSFNYYDFEPVLVERGPPPVPVKQKSTTADEDMYEADIALIRDQLPEATQEQVAAAYIRENRDIVDAILSLMDDLTVSTLNRKKTNPSPTTVDRKQANPSPTVRTQCLKDESTAPHVMEYEKIRHPFQGLFFRSKRCATCGSTRGFGCSDCNY